MKIKSIKTTKSVLGILICLLFLQLPAQNKLSSSDWQADLRFLQETVHKDYPFLFKKTTAKEFDRLAEQLHRNIPQMQEHEIMVGFARVVSSFKYGHTALGFRGGPIKYHQLPFILYQFNDGVYLQAVHKDYKKALGARVLAIEGVPIAKALKNIYPVVPAENDQYFKAYGINYLRIPEVLHAQGLTKELKNTISLSLEQDGKSFEQLFTAVEAHNLPRQYGMVKPGGDWLDSRDTTKTPLYLKSLDKIYYYEYLPKQKTVYVRQSQIQDDPSEDIPAFYKRVFDFIDKNEVEKLILDVRLNGGGNNYKNKPVVTGIIKAEKINRPGKLFVIIGRRTFSACQNLINELDNYTNTIFVGEPSAENINFYGDNRRVELPNSKLPVFLSFAWWQDKPQWENEDWTAPHLAVDMSFEEYRSNQDPVLEAALNFSDTNFILDPMGHLTSLFMNGEYGLVQSEAERMVRDPKYRFFDFQAQFDRVGHRMLGQNIEGATFVFEMNAKLFPKSANVWDSLATAYFKANNVGKARECYNKALQLDPNGTIGDNAREMLKKTKQ